MMNEHLTATTSLPEAAYQVISNKRKAQEELLRFKDKAIGTAVLSFSVHGRAFASIASSEFVELNMLASYASFQSKPELGILALLEEETHEVVFLNPLWIWHE